MLFLVVIVSGALALPSEESVSNLSMTFMRGMISVTPQGDPSSFGGEINMLVGMGVNTINTFHGTPSNNEIFLGLADEAGIGCIPSIPLICWIRFGDPPYPTSGSLGRPTGQCVASALSTSSCRPPAATSWVSLTL